MLVAIIVCLLLVAGIFAVRWNIRRHARQRHRNLVIEFKKMPPTDEPAHRS